jgi:hypothetical protein
VLKINCCCRPKPRHTTAAALIPLYIPTDFQASWQLSCNDATEPGKLQQQAQPLLHKT